MSVTCLSHIRDMSVTENVTFCVSHIVTEILRSVVSNPEHALNKEANETSCQLASASIYLALDLCTSSALWNYV
jgi:hypothetical protein